MAASVERAGESSPLSGSIRIGVSLPFTGRYAKNAGVTYNDTYRFWVEKVNAAGGLLGRPVVLTAYDDESNPEKASELYKRLISEDKVDFVLGPCHSVMTEAVAPVVERARKVLLQGSGSSHEIFEQNRKYVFLCWSGCDFDYPRSLFELLVTLPESKRPARAALVYTNGRIGSAVALGTRHFSTQYGVLLVHDEPIGDAPFDYDGLFQRVKQSDPEVVLVGLDHTRPDEPLRSSVEAYQNAGLRDRILWLSDNPSPRDPTDLLDRAFMRTTWTPESPGPVSQAFAREFKAAYGHRPEYHHAGGYACCQVLQQAVEIVGGRDNEDLRTCLLDGIFETVMGRLSFQESGLPDATMQLSQWVDGSLRIVYPPSEQTAAAVL